MGRFSNIQKLTYEYDCPKCGVIEIRHVMSMTKRKCPECGAKIERLIGIPILSKMGDARTIKGQMDKNSDKETVGERDARLQKQNELAPMTEKEKQDKAYGDKVQKLSRMNEDQATRYIEQGIM